LDLLPVRKVLLRYSYCFIFDVLIDVRHSRYVLREENEGEINDFLRKIAPLVVSMSREPAAG